MIIRVLGQGQYRFNESHRADLNACDDAVEAAVAAGDQEHLTEALKALIDEIRNLGQELPFDSLEESDLIVPDVDATLDEVRTLLDGNSFTEGLIPGRS